MASFVVLAGVIIVIGEGARRAQAALSLAHRQMEETVQQRTAELTLANEKLRELSTRLLHLQDDERRRLARDLHDGVGQLLAAISMNLGTLRRAKLDVPHSGALQDLEQILDQSINEVRTLSHLLHPPLLDESGLSSALRVYLEGFSTRSKVTAELQVPEDLPRLSEETEIAIFRIVQECLNNCHKHAQASAVKVSVEQLDGRVVVQVSDNGKGMPTGKPLGVGLTGMQERTRDLHGTFELRSSSLGTTVVVALPLTTSTRPAALAVAAASS